MHGTRGKPVPGAPQDVRRRPDVARWHRVGHVHQGGAGGIGEQPRLELGDVAVAGPEIGEQGGDGHA